MRDPEFMAERGSAPDKPARPGTFDITRDLPGFRRLVRTAILGFLQDVAAGDAEAAWMRLAPADAAAGSAEGLAEARRIEAAFTPYFESRQRLRLDPEGRSAKHTHFDEEDSATWRVAQVLVDPEDLNDWEAVFTVSVADSRTQNRPVITFESAGPIGA